MRSFCQLFWLICLALVLFFSVPCYAQVETQRFLPPERTDWQIENPDPQFFSGNNVFLGFFANYVWLCDEITCTKLDNSDYKNRLISRFNASQCLQTPTIPPSNICFTVSGYTFSLLKFGKVNFCIYANNNIEDCFESTLKKINNDFAYIP